MSSEKDVMICRNKKVFDFYKSNPSLDFEQICILCVDLFENILQDATSAINKSISSQILHECMENKNRIMELNSSISKISSDMLLKSMEIKRDYIEEVKTIINSNTNEKIRTLIEKCIEQMLDKNSISNNALLTDIGSKIDKGYNDISSKIEKDNSSIVSKLEQGNNSITSKLEQGNNSIVSKLEQGNNSIVSKLEQGNQTLLDKTTILLTEINSTSMNKLSSLLDNTTSHLLDKTNIMLNELIPENQEKSAKHIQEEIVKFYTLLSSDLKQMCGTKELHNNQLVNLIEKCQERLNSSSLSSSDLATKQDKLTTEITTFMNKNKEDQIAAFISNFESKYTQLLQTIQTPFISMISTSEKRISSNISSLQDVTSKQQLTQEKIFANLEDFLNKYRNSSHKGNLSENHIHNVLTKMFPTAEIIDTSGKPSSGDMIVKREGKDVVLIENKNYDKNVNPEEVKKFIVDCDTQKTHGIFLSQNTGITSKGNYHIDIHKGTILVYVHNVEYMANKIQIAFDIIDSLSAKFKKLNIKDSDDNIISKEIMDDINDEFQRLIAQKESLTNMVKDFHKRLLQQIEELRIPTLDNYLSSKYASIQKAGYICENCNIFKTTTIKSLSAHKRGCKSKITSTSNIVVNTSQP